MVFKKHLCSSVLVAALAVNSLAYADNSAAVSQALQSADEWLSLLDNNKYGETWDKAASGFKALDSKDNWQKSIQAVKSPLGKVISRQEISHQYTTTLPGAPDGDYVVIQYQTSFKNKKSAVETITPTLDKDGQWRISGYYIR